MAISLNTIFGVHDSALIYQSKRAEVLASNMANADTPGYKARDFNFKDVLSQLEGGQPSNLKTTHSKHIGLSTSPASVDLAYRIPTSSSLDGNTVDAKVEQAQYAENAMNYQTSLRFVNGKISSYLSALRGE